MDVDEGVVLRPRSVGGRWNVWSGKPNNDGVEGRSGIPRLRSDYDKAG